MEDRYTSGEYLEANPDWHIEDSPWKARQILKMIRKNGLQPKTVCEVGCGAGEILSQLQRSLPEADYTGYEISPQAYALSQPRASERLRFHLGDLLETDETFDLVLCIDVFEHIPDYLGFLGRLRRHGRHHLFHIPLDLSLLTILRPGRLIKGRYTVGHLHHYTYETALAVLKDSGYEVVDATLTAGGLELAKSWRHPRTIAANGPRWLVSRFSRRLAARLFGGFSLLVLAK
jgi:2-polyprenyl-3-methyl-5-hydroxy-6-metoxy-1,4-benzoquinol methylase